ncbi:MAG: DUF4402 domain-containing protein [Bacteroidales bacterium]|nr:DUF4402 domain-containing protein [Bacteroidales bacterium]
MKTDHAIYKDHGVRIIKPLIILLLTIISAISFAQEDPPRPIEVTVTGQQLTFGAFTHGASGGTVTVEPTGSRSSTGDVILLGLGYPYYPTLYEIIGNPGTVISILNGPDAILPGSNGGSITLTIGSSDPASPFVLTAVYPNPNTLYIGGTVTIGNSAANPPGFYSGTYDVTFVQE